MLPHILHFSHFGNIIITFQKWCSTMHWHIWLCDATWTSHDLALITWKFFVMYPGQAFLPTSIFISSSWWIFACSLSSPSKESRWVLEPFELAWVAMSLSWPKIPSGSSWLSLKCFLYKCSLVASPWIPPWESSCHIKIIVPTNAIHSWQDNINPKIL